METDADLKTAMAAELSPDARLSLDHERSDSDIAAGSGKALQRNTLVPLERIRPTVDHGGVALRGDDSADLMNHLGASR